MAELERLLVRIEADTAGLRRGLDRSEKQIVKTQKVVTGLGNAFTGLGRTLVGLAGAFGIREIARAADNYKVLRDRVKAATDGTNDFVEVNSELLAISQRTFSGLENNVKLFQRMAIGARAFGATNQEVLKVTEAVQQLGIIGGATTESLRFGTTQFAQAMTSGIVRAEEMNSILENIPEVAVAIARGLGMSVGELRKAVISGEVLSQDVFDALLKQTDEINDKFSDMETTLTRAFTNLGTVLTQVVGKLDEATGFTSKTADIINTLTAMIARDFGIISEDAGELAVKQFKLREELETQALLLEQIDKLEKKRNDNGGKLNLLDQWHLDTLKEDLKTHQEILGALQARIDVLQHGGTKPTEPPADGEKPDTGPLPPPEKVQKTIDALRFAEEQLRRTAREQFVYEALQKAGIDANSEYAASVRKEAEELFEMQETLDRLEQEERELNDAQDAFNRLIEEGKSLLASVATEEERLVALQDRLNYLVEQGALTQEQANVVMSRTVDQMQRAQIETDKTGDMARQLGMTFTSAFENALVAGNDLRSVIQALAQDLLRLITRMFVIQPLFNAFTGSLAGAGITGGTAYYSGGQSITWSTGRQFAQGGVMTGRGPVPLRRYAAGGIAKSPQLAMFGEGSKPEAYVPLPDGRAIPVRMEGGQQAGNVFNINQEINLAPGVQQIARVEVMRMLPQIAEASARAIGEANRRGSGI